MRFVVDAQLPLALAEELRALGLDILLALRDWSVFAFLASKV